MDVATGGVGDDPSETSDGASRHSLAVGGDSRDSIDAQEGDALTFKNDPNPPTERRHSYFQRSESTIFLGCPLPDPFHTPLTEALPLADQPHLLQPNARKEDLFG